MKFQFYVIHLDEGSIAGTNDIDIAKQFMQDDSYAILTAQHGIYYCGSTVEHNVEELNETEEVDEENEDD